MAEVEHRIKREDSSLIQPGISEGSSCPARCPQGAEGMELGSPRFREIWGLQPMLSSLSAQVLGSSNPRGKQGSE